MIVVLGMAGAGKSTQCSALSETGKYRWVSMSGLLKEHETPEIRAYMSSGKMVPKEVAVPLIEKDLTTYSDSPEVLLDGFPRTLEQAQAVIDENTILPRKVVHLKVSETVALERLAQRQRSDDTPKAIHQRFLDYYTDITAILNIFRHAGVTVIEINADLAPDEVTNAIKKELDK